MDNSRVLLFAILGDSRCLGAMCQASYLIGLGCNVVLCVQHIQPGVELGTEAVAIGLVVQQPGRRSERGGFLGVEYGGRHVMVQVPTFRPADRVLHAC